MNTVAEKVASYLLDIKAIKLEPTHPFTWASGWKSPIYCDNRKTLSYPEVRSYIKEQFAALIREKYPQAEVIAGVATGAIAQGVLVAQELGLPFIYVRSSAKSHGLENLIEGEYKAGQKVVVIEDLISTGGSSLQAVEALRNAECEVLGMVAIFTRWRDTMAGSALISQWSEPLTASPAGEAFCSRLAISNALTRILPHATLFKAIRE